MIRTLVSVNKDLASSVALRYACNMARAFDIAFQAIHVQDPGPDYNLPGTGWVRRTWESALGESGKTEIEQLFSSENVDYPLLGRPKIQIGEQEDQILLELHRERYDLFMTGALSTFKASDLHKMLRSKLFRNMPSPAAVLVKNLVSLDSMVLVVEYNDTQLKSIPVFSNLFRQSSLGFNLIVWQPDRNNDPAAESGSDADLKIEPITELLGKSGCTPEKAEFIKCKPAGLAASLKKFGLVAAGIDRAAGKKDPVLELLARTESPVMLLWQ
jgi:hypothetical protein